MNPDPLLVIEEQGPDWSFTYDLSNLPEYSLLVLRGKPTASRIDKLIEVLRDNLAVVTQDGTFYPTIIDVQEDGRLSMDSLRAAMEVAQEFGAQVTYSVFVMDAERSDSTIFRHFMTMLEKLSPGAFAVVTNREEASALARAYNRRRRVSPLRF